LLGELKIDIPFIIATGTVGEEMAVEAMRSGARDYVLKDRLKRLAPIVERELLARDARERSAEALRASQQALQHSDDQLRQAQKLEAIGRLAGAVAHDFNNLLSVILSYSMLLSSSLEPGDPMIKDLGEIRKAGERAAALTQQLLAFGRRQVLQPAVLSLDQLIATMEAMLGRLIGEDVELRITSAPGLGRVKVDPSQVHQVVMNLAVNSRDAMPEGGQLTIEMANVTLDAAYAAERVDVQPGAYVMLAISDTGTGMDKQTQARIFEPFFTTKEEGKGTGLGLSTVFGIVKQSGGHIWLYSELDRGTVFKIYFPEVDPREASTDVRRDSDIESLQGAETILVVEDDESVRNITCAILRRRGYHVLDCPSAGDALLLCEQHPAKIHMLLTDVVMPRISGRQLAERLQTIRPEILVLYMSGYTDDSIIRHGVLDSDVAFIQKPITPVTLAKKVREVLGIRKRPSQG
jgi:signal transduction histidine kinase